MELDTNSRSPWSSLMRSLSGDPVHSVLPFAIVDLRQCAIPTIIVQQDCSSCCVLRNLAFCLRSCAFLRFCLSLTIGPGFHNVNAHVNCSQIFRRLIFRQLRPLHRLHASSLSTTTPYIFTPRFAPLHDPFLASSFGHLRSVKCFLENSRWQTPHSRPTSDLSYRLADLSRLYAHLSYVCTSC